MSLIENPAPAEVVVDREVPARLACAAGAGLALVPFVLCSFSGDTGPEIAASLADDSVPLQIGAAVAAFAGALMVLAAVRLGRRIPGTAGLVAGAAGVAVAVLFVAYYAAFGVGGLLAGDAVAEPDPAIGVGTSLLVNFAEITRYAPGLALVAAAVVARRSLPRGVWIVAAVLVVATAFPMTSWAAALLIPLWLGVSASVVRVQR